VAIPRGLIKSKYQLKRWGARGRGVFLPVGSSPIKVSCDPIVQMAMYGRERDKNYIYSWV